MTPQEVNLRLLNALAVDATTSIFRKTGKLIWWSCASVTFTGLLSAFESFVRFLSMWGVEEFLENANECGMNLNRLRIWLKACAQTLGELETLVV